MSTRHIAQMAVAILLIASTAQTDTIFVDASCPGGDGSELDPYCSIQTGIDNAVDGDGIIVAPGTYFETIDFLGKVITVRSSRGAAMTTIDASGSSSVVTCNIGERPDTVLDGYTITGGSAIRGGGMYDDHGSSPTVQNGAFYV